MHPILFKIGTIEIQSFWVMIVLGVAFASFLGCRYIQYLRRNRPQEVWIDLPTPRQGVKLTLLAFIFGLIGARLAHVIWNIAKYIQEPSRIFMIYSGGMISFGAQAAVTLVCLIYAKTNKLNALKTLDLFFAYLPIADAIRRLGCFLNGCCFGKFTNSWVGLSLPLETLSRGVSLPRHPVPLYFVALFLLIFFLLKIKRWRPHKAGTLVLGYFLIYSSGRFFIEFFRPERVISRFFPLKVPQLICLGIFIGSIVSLKRLRKQSGI